MPQNNPVVIAYSGDLISEKAMTFKNTLNQLAHQHDYISVNLLDVNDVDIVGLNAVISSVKILHEKGGELEILCKRQARFSKLINLCKFNHLLSAKYVD